jgi:integrase/recombinase XerD
MLNSSATLTNSELIDLWLHGKSKNTVDGYRRYAEQFFLHVNNKRISDCTLMDIQTWEMTLRSSDNSKRVAVGAIKSLFSFAKELGVIPSNLGILVKSPKGKNRLAERILTEEQVQLLINATTNKRDTALAVSFAIARLSACSILLGCG